MYDHKRIGFTFKCYTCQKPLLANSMILQTKSLCGSFEYCVKCASDKGYNVEDKFKPFDKLLDLSYLDRETFNNSTDDINLNRLVSSARWINFR